MAQSSQRSQLLAIVDDLNEQLQQMKATTVKTEKLESELEAHSLTRQLLETKNKRIADLEKEVTALNGSL